MIRITDTEFRLLAKYIKKHSGIDLKEEKKTLLVGRLNNLLSGLGFGSFTQYYKYLKDDVDGKKLSNLLDKVTTNHTYFMREAEHFTYLTQEVLPYLKNNVKDRDLRIWCGASSSGEEPYTLGILLEEYFKTEMPGWNKKLLATDISLKVLNQAVQGVYSSDQIDLLPKMWVLNHFEQIGNDSFRVKQHIKKEVIFRRFNLLEPVYPFKKKMHVIFLRNVMIYFDEPTKQRLIAKLYDQLEYGGYLFIGHSESIPRGHSRFRYIKPAVYRKI